MFPILALKGVSHSSFMDSTMLPDQVKNHDIKPELSEAESHKVIARAITSFVAGLEGVDNKDTLEDLIAFTDEFMKPLLDSMYLEGSYTLKNPC